ncbi:hypothetical protein [Algoriphagus confluentis]|uniref:Uncharacterized protein n=1 Tax=Algoriphagus confluentis TaxID=1697556 RepID=A0ABQ6PMH1_9BACT|nr:hypothetical protein Aconfl_17690 [Algoriphagus confluentis]
MKAQKHKILKVQFLNGLVLFLITFGLISCHEDLLGDTDPSTQLPTESNLPYSTSLKNQLASRVAKNLAASLDDSGVIDFLRTKANEKIDGDFNFLIEQNRNESVGINSGDLNKRARTFGLIISGKDLNSKRATNAENLLDSIARIHPLLQVYMPELSGEIDFSSDQDYLVAYVPIDMKNDIIPAYDKQGNYFELDANNPPARPVIVISENERLMAIPKNPIETKRILEDCPLLAEAVFENELNTYYMRQDVLESNNACIIGGGGGPIGSGPSIGCERENRPGKERLYRFKLKDMNTFDAVKDQWINGDLEIELAITVAPLNGNPFSITKTFYLDNSDVRDCGIFTCDTEWVYDNAEIITWNRSLYGENMFFAWTEYDPGTTITRNYSFSNTYKIDANNSVTSNVSYSRTITDGTDDLGESVVEYCDEIGTDGFTYSTSGIFFQV